MYLYVVIQCVRGEEMLKERGGVDVKIFMGFVG